MPSAPCFRQVSAPTYVIGFLLIVTGVVGFVVQTPYLSIYPAGKFENGLEVTLAAENAPTLKFDYFSLAWHSEKEQADAMREEIIIHGNRENHQGWYAMVSGEENRPKLRILHKNGLSLSVNDWSGISDGSGSQPKGTLSFGKSPTALIPALFGLILIGCVVGSQRKEALRKHLMHLAALVGLLGTIAPGIMAWSAYRALDEVKILLGELATNPNTQPPSPAKFLSQGVTAALCFFFLVLCIQSFVKARKEQPVPAKSRPPLRDGDKSKSIEKKDKDARKTDSTKEKEREKLRDRGKPPKAREKKEKRDSEKTKESTSRRPDDSISSSKKKLSPKPAPASAKDAPGKPSFSKSITKTTPEKPHSTEKKPKDKKADPIKKPGPPKPVDKKDIGPMPPSPAPKGSPGKPPTPPGKLPSPGKKPEPDSEDMKGKSSPPKPPGKKDLGPMPPPPKESPSKPPPPPGSISQPGKSDSSETKPAPKKDATDPKIGKFRLSGNKPIRINRPKDTESSPNKKEDGED